MSKELIKAKPILTDEDLNKRVKTAVKIALDRQQAMGVPVTMYDRQKGCIYIVNEKGEKVIVGRISDKRRYSERSKDGKKT